MRISCVFLQPQSLSGTITLGKSEFEDMVDSACAELEGRGFKVIGIDTTITETFYTAAIKYRKPRFWIF